MSAPRMRARAARGPSTKLRTGFTLIELLITIAITAMVFGMISAILFSVLTASEQVQSRMRTEKTGYGCLSLMRRDIEAAYGYALSGAPFKGERSSVSGHEADNVWLVTAAKAPPDSNGKTSAFQRVAYRLANVPTSGGAPTTGLYRRTSPLGPQDDPLGGGEYSLVCGGISGLKLSYYDAKQKNWIDGEWKQTDQMPRAVKVALTLAPEVQDPNAPPPSPEDEARLTFTMVVAIPSRCDAPPEQSPVLPGASPSPTP